MKTTIKITTIAMIGMSLGIKAQVTDTGDRVGIGITNPGKKLHILNSNSYEAGIIETSNQAGSNLRYIDNTGKAIEIGSQQGDAVIRTNSTVRIIAKSGSGNVGIGITIPATKLHVKGKTQVEHSTLNSSIIFDGHEGITTSGSSHWLHLNRYSNDNVSIGTNSLANVYLANGGGHVGIGTTSTGNHRLAVEGSIGAREIKVEANGWSDFVFYDDYNLPTLSEVENHIKAKGHLKDIPSAAEVKKNGVFLGEMDSKLLQKIEELTLYTIDQQKEIDSQKKEIKELKALFQKLIKDKN